MSNTQIYRKQIASIKSTQTITGAMQLVATSRIAKAQKRMEQSRPYAEKIQQILGHLASSQHHSLHRAFIPMTHPKHIGMIVIATDSGLCGGMNLNLSKAIVTQQKEWSTQHITTPLCLIGRKAMTFFQRLDMKILGYTENLGHKPVLSELIGVIKVMLNAFYEETLDAVYLCYNHFCNTMVQQPTLIQLLPLKEMTPDHQRSHWDYLYETEFESMLDILLSRYIEALVYQAVLENIACEQSARMIAMKNATDNAGDLIKSLQLIYNKVRQAGITQEIAEMIAGAESV